MKRAGLTPEVRLAHIAEADRQHRKGAQDLRRLVGQAREVGISWEAIGDALGVTRQAAQQRFGRNPVMDQLAANDELGTNIAAEQLSKGRP
jgi:hypothetical protein